MPDGDSRARTAVRAPRPRGVPVTADLDRAAMREVAEAATPGPWELARRHARPLPDARRTALEADLACRVQAADVATSRGVRHVRSDCRDTTAWHRPRLQPSSSPAGRRTDRLAEADLAEAQARVAAVPRTPARGCRSARAARATCVELYDRSRVKWPRLGTCRLPSDETPDARARHAPTATAPLSGAATLGRAGRDRPHQRHVSAVGNPTPSGVTTRAPHRDKRPAGRSR